MIGRLFARVWATDPFDGAPQTERSARSLSAWLGWCAVIVMIAMSVFHLWAGTFGAHTAMVQRSIHLAFAAGLAFLVFPTQLAEMAHRIGRGATRLTCFFIPPLRDRRERGLDRLDALLASWVARRQEQPWRTLIALLEAVLLLGAVSSALYVTVYHEALAQRAGWNTQLDLIVAGVGVVMVLEATRRSISPLLAGIATLFLLYALFGHWLPGDWGHAPLSVRRILTQQYYTLDGIFGIPLKVSSTFVFLFVLFGAALERSGAGKYLIDLSFAAMGRFRGGPAKAAVFASGLMGTVSGSSIANTVTTGSLTIPLMKKVGFKPHVAGAVEVAASTNGQLMPPVMGAAAFVMADMTGIPYATIIVAALLPAVLSYTVIFTMIHLEALRSGIQATDPADRPPLWRTLLRGLHLNIPFIAILVLLLGLPAGVRDWFEPWLAPVRDTVDQLPDALQTMAAPFTPYLDLSRHTPSTAAATTIWTTLVVFLLVCLFARRTAYGLERVKEHAQARRSIFMSFRARGRHFIAQSVAALRDGAMNMIGIACACACCGIIIGVVAQTGMGFKITRLIEELSGGALLPALIMTAAASILLGVGLPTTATYIIMATLTAPAILDIAAPDQVEYAIPLLLATHLFVFYYGILADDTPPVGLCAYAAAGIAGSDPVRTGIASFRLDLAAFLLPLVFFFNHELLLIDVTWMQVAWVLPGALIGMICFAMALQGYGWGRLTWWARVMLVAAAFLLVKPTLWMTGVGVVLAIAAVLAGRRGRAAGTAFRAG